MTNLRSRYRILFVLLLLTFASLGSAFAGNQFIVYQGRILRPDGTPLDGAHKVQIKVYSPDPARCLLWAEESTIPFGNGAFTVQIGSNLQRLTGADAGGAASFANVFMNDSSLVLTGLRCAQGSSYTPSASDDRIMVATVTDGTTEVKAFDGPIKAVPFALQSTNSTMVGGYTSEHLIKVNPAGASQAARTFSTLGFNILYDLAESPTVQFGNKTLTGLNNPTQAQDAATKAYVDSIFSGGGTLSVVSLVNTVSTLPFLTVTGGPITSSGTFTIGMSNQAAGSVLAAPTGASGVPSFRSLVASDLPSLDTSMITSGTLPVSRGGTGNGTLLPNALLMANIAGDAVTSMVCSPGQILVWQVAGGWTCTTQNAGSVTAVDLTMPSIFSVSGGPITSEGTLSVSLSSQLSGLVLASPTGGAGSPTFRALASSDIPSLDAAKITTGTLATTLIPDLDAAKITSGILPTSRGGSGLNTSTAADGQLLIGNGAGFSLANLTAGTGISVSNTAGGITITSTLAGGTVTNVGLSMPGIFAVTGSPVTGGGLAPWRSLWRIKRLP